jgi:quinol monooxygenase YgiN
MEGHVAWMLEVAIKEGQLDAFEELMREMVEGTSAEPQTLAYEWYISEDRQAVHLFEKYLDSDAMISHVNGFLEKWAGRFMECVDFKRFIVYGDPSPAAREILDGWRATYMAPWGGFSRFA